MCSPSDLDADFEDNQDYDSTVSQSETKLPMFIPSSRVDSVQEVESPTSADSLMAVRTVISDPTELQRVSAVRVTNIIAIMLTFIIVIIIMKYLAGWLGGVVVSLSDSWSRGHGFDSWLAHRQATTLGKLLTPMCLCYQAVQFGTGQRAVMLCDWEGNHRSGVALAVHNRL